MNTKVYGLFKQEMLMPYMHEALIDVYSSQDDAEVVCKDLNDNNKNPMEEDSYGPYCGCRYFVAELEVK